MLRSRLVVAFPLVCGLLCSALVAQEAGSADLKTAGQKAGDQNGDLEVRLGKALREVHQSTGIPAITAAVAVNGKIVWAEAVGERRRGEAGKDGKPVAVDEHTLFQAASISKPLTAMAVMKLVESEALDLDKPVADLPGGLALPRSGDVGKTALTLRHLLAHLGGTTVHGFPGYAPGKKLPTIAEVLAGKGNTDAVVIDAPVGGQFRYSGGGYCLVQQILTATRKQTFPELMRELVLEPVGMKESGYLQPLPEELRSKAACAHDRSGKAMDVRWHVYPEMAAAGMWTTPSDLLRALLAMRASERGDEAAFLPKSLASEMLTPQKKGSNFGIGWMVRREGARWMYGHSGSNQGFLCDARLTRIGDREVGFVVMINSEQRSIGEVPQALLRAVMANGR